MPERRACRVLGQSRSTQRRVLVQRDDEEALTQAIVGLASEYGRYGYRRVTALLRTEGWYVNHKRVERIWRREGLKVPTKQPKRDRLWLNDGSCVRLRPRHRHHVWSYDFVMDRTHDGRAFRMLTVIDEHTRECLAIRTERRQNQETVLETLSDLFLLHGPPEHLRSDNGANGKLRDQLLNGEIFFTLKEAQVLVEQWRRHYNTIREHSSLGYRPPAPQTMQPPLSRLAMPIPITTQ